MTVKMIQVLELNGFYGSVKDRKLPFKTAYKFSRLIGIIQSDIKFFETEMDKLLIEYGEKDEEGNFVSTSDNKGVVIKEDVFEECQEAINELYNLPITIDGDISFSLEELDFLDVSPQEINILMPFIRE